MDGQRLNISVGSFYLFLFYIIGVSGHSLGYLNYMTMTVVRGPCSILPAVLHVYMLRRHFILLPNLFNRTIAFDIAQYMLLPERPNIPRNATNCVKPYIY